MTLEEVEELGPGLGFRVRVVEGAEWGVSA